jgi:hypothetical protein
MPMVRQEVSTLVICALQSNTTSLNTSICVIGYCCCDENTVGVNYKTCKELGIRHCNQCDCTLSGWDFCWVRYYAECFGNDRSSQAPQERLYDMLTTVNNEHNEHRGGYIRAAIKHHYPRYLDLCDKMLLLH